MTYSITGVAYLILLFVLGYLFYRLFHYWKKEKDAASKQALYIVAFFSLFVLNATISGLFFANNPIILERAARVSVFIQAFAFAAVAYHVIYLKFSKISPWVGFIPVFILGLIAAILSTFYLQLNPFLEASGSINWGSSSGSMAVPVLLLRVFISLVTLTPLTIIFLLQYKNLENHIVRRKSLGMGLVSLFILIGALLDFLFIRIFNLDPIWRDMVFIVCGAILLITLVLTLSGSKTKPLKYETKI